MLDLVNGLFCIYWNDLVIFFFKSIYVFYYIYWFTNIEPFLHIRDKTNFIIMDNLLIYLNVLFTNILVNIFESMFIRISTYSFLLLYLYLVLTLEWYYFCRRNFGLLILFLFSFSSFLSSLHSIVCGSFFESLVELCY